MTATLEKAFGYQGDSMLPVQDLAAALPFYETVLGFRVLSRSDTPYDSAVLVRDEVQIGLAESGGDPRSGRLCFSREGPRLVVRGVHRERARQGTLRIRYRTTRRGRVEGVLCRRA